MKTLTTLLFRNYSIFLSPMPQQDEFFLATAKKIKGEIPVTTSPTGLQRVDRSPETAIALLQRVILWTEVFESESPGALVQLAPFRLVYANEATGGKKLEERRSLTENWTEAERDRYLMALFRDGVYSGYGVQAERICLINGSSFCLEKAQLNLQ